MLARLSQAERLLTRAQNLSAHGNVTEAIAAFEAAHRLSPDHPGVRLHWALALAEAGRYDEAYDIIGRDTGQRLSGPVLNLFRGQVCFDREDYQTAKTHFQCALDNDPFNILPQAFLALIDLIEGHVEASYHAFTRPLSIPAGTIEHMICRYGLSQVPSTLQLATVVLQSRLLLMIETYFWQQHLSPRSLSQQLVDCQQTQSSCWSTRCLTAFDAGLTHTVLGVRRFLVALRYLCDPNLRAAAFRHIAADENYYLCQTSQAIASYQKLLERQPESLIIKQRLFDLFYESGDFDNALTYFQDMTRYGTSEHQPTSLDCLFLGELLYLAGDTKAARRYLDQAAASRINEYKLHYFIGLDELRAGRKTNARQHFARALRILNPDICLLRLQELNRVYTGKALQKPLDKTCSV